MEYHSGGSLPLLGRPRYCPGAKANGGYLCETGHCCGETGCCTYYYELWWFWLLWTVLILFSCCCAYRHRRAKLRVQQQQRQREISLLAYHGATSFPSSMLDLSFLASLKLPSYEEVAAQPSTPPPPYSSVFTAPRYPQPPRASDPHLLTQHGPLLHRRLSDGPSSFSSDNSSSSCSCDSCCPSSPCSSSISAPVTYETDTSHATTPGEATPLTLDVTAETIAAAAIRLEVNETRLVCERTAAMATVDISDEGPTGAQKPSAKDSSAPRQTGPGSEVVLNVVSKSPVKELDPAVCIPAVSACSPSSLCSPTVDTKLPSIQIISNEDSDDGLKITPVPKTTSAVSSSDHPAATQVLDLTRTPASAPSPDVGRTLVLMTGSSELQSPDLSPILVPVPVPSNSAKASIPEPTSQPSILVIPDLTQSPDPVPSNLSMVSNPHPKSPTVPDSALVSLKPADVTRATLTHYQSLDPATEPADSSPSLDPSHSPGSDLTSSSPPNVQAAFSSGSESGSSKVGSGSGPSPGLSSVSSSCPAITIECETLSLSQSPPAALPSPPSLTSPPALSSILLPAPALLLDPLTVPLQSSKGGSSSGHASSLSPSPRATQSPPKQTLFSPCVDVFEPRPPSWEDEEEEQEDEDNEDDDDEDMGADESQYRHRRLTGDSGIEVCRCRVEEEEEEEEKGGKEEEGGGEVGNLDLHDRLDCPARSEMTTGEGVPLCNSTSTPIYEEGVKVVVVMEMV